MKRLLLLSILLIGVSCYSSRNVRIMTYNIRNGIGIDETMNIERTADVISEVCPDLIAVQEVDSVTGRSNGTYILGELAARTGMQPYYSPAIDFDGGKYGIGILSKESPSKVVKMALPGREEARTLLLLEFADYLFCCTHLSLTEEDRAESIRIISTLPVRFDKPLFIAGDFNDIPNSKDMAKLRDSFTMLNNPETNTFPSDAPSETLDYIMVSKDSSMVKVESTNVVETTASDHRPVIVNITLNDK